MQILLPKKKGAVKFKYRKRGVCKSLEGYAHVYATFSLTTTASHLHCWGCRNHDNVVQHTVNKTPFLTKTSGVIVDRVGYLLICLPINARSWSYFLLFIFLAILIVFAFFFVYWYLMHAYVFLDDYFKCILLLCVMYNAVFNIFVLQFRWGLLDTEFCFTVQRSFIW